MTDIPRSELMLSTEEFAVQYDRMFGANISTRAAVVETVAANLVFLKHGINFTPEQFYNGRREYMIASRNPDFLKLNRREKIRLGVAVNKMFEIKYNNYLIKTTGRC